jgi:hypothetical protein
MCSSAGDTATNQGNKDMAYVSQEMKKELSPAIKAVLKKYGMKASIAVKNHMTLVCNIKSGKLDILTSAQRGNDRIAERQGRESYQVGNYLQVNTSWIDDHYDDEGVRSFLLELKAAMEGKNFFCDDDMMTDYFHRSHYIDINVGQWNKPYQLEVA